MQAGELFLEYFDCPAAAQMASRPGSLHLKNSTIPVLAAANFGQYARAQVHAMCLSMRGVFCVFSCGVSLLFCFHVAAAAAATSDQPPPKPQGKLLWNEPRDGILRVRDVTQEQNLVVKGMIHWYEVFTRFPRN